MQLCFVFASVCMVVSVYGMHLWHGMYLSASGMSSYLSLRAMCFKSSEKSPNCTWHCEFDWWTWDRNLWLPSDSQRCKEPHPTGYEHRVWRKNKAKGVSPLHHWFLTCKLKTLEKQLQGWYFRHFLNVSSIDSVPVWRHLFGISSKNEKWENWGEREPKTQTETLRVVSFTSVVLLKADNPGRSCQRVSRHLLDLSSWKTLCVCGATAEGSTCFWHIQNLEDMSLETLGAVLWACSSPVTVSLTQLFPDQPDACYLPLTTSTPSCVLSIGQTWYPFVSNTFLARLVFLLWQLDSVFFSVYTSCQTIFLCLSSLCLLVSPFFHLV